MNWRFFNSCRLWSSQKVNMEMQMQYARIILALCMMTKEELLLQIAIIAICFWKNNKKFAKPICHKYTILQATLWVAIWRRIFFANMILVLAINKKILESDEIRQKIISWANNISSNHCAVIVWIQSKPGYLILLRFKVSYDCWEERLYDLLQ